MLAFISCAKTMASRSTLQVPQMTNPRFTDEALRHALSLARYSASELGGMLRVNAKIAAENCIRTFVRRTISWCPLSALIPERCSNVLRRKILRRMISFLHKNTCVSLLSCMACFVRWMAFALIVWRGMCVCQKMVELRCSIIGNLY